MHYEEYECFDSGDKVNLIDDTWYKERGFKKFNKDTIMTVDYQNGDEVRTNYGYFDFCKLELFEE